MSTGSRDGVARVPVRVWFAVRDAVLRFGRSVSLCGLVLGTLAFAASTGPSLVPRGWLYQGVLAGLSLAVGYGLGALLRHLLGLFRLPDLLTGERRTLVRRIMLGAFAVVVVVTVITGAHTQRRLARLWGLEPTAAVHLVSTISTALVIAVLLVLAWRGLRAVVRALDRLLDRWLPRPVAAVLSLVLVLALLVTALNGALHRFVLGSITATFTAQDATTPPGASQPAVPERSGSPGSTQAWDTLGYQGRQFVSGGPDASEIEAVTGREAMEPIRVYAGLASQPGVEQADVDLDELARDVVAELDRTGAWQRKVLAVVTTTGTGWVDPRAAAALEYLEGGDTAIAAMQYSANPSWVTLSLDIEQPALAGRALFDAVQARWAQLPPDDRPLLVAFGLSLGSYGSQAAFGSLADLAARADGAVWVGTPRFTALWSDLTSRRDPGTTEVAPVLDGGAIVRWGTANVGDQGLAELGPGGEPRVVYLQHPSDGVVWWWLSSFWKQDDWYREPPGQDVLPGIHWWPVISGLQLTADMFVAGDPSVPLGYGHNYGGAYVDAWAWVTQPAGWDPSSLEQLRQVVEGADG